MGKETGKDFRTRVLEIISCRDCRIYDTPCNSCLDEATSILSLCKEMLVLGVSNLDEGKGSNCDSNYDAGWNACRSELLKQLGD